MSPTEWSRDSVHRSCGGKTCPSSIMSCLTPPLATDVIAGPFVHFVHVVDHLVLPRERLASTLLASRTTQFRAPEHWTLMGVSSIKMSSKVRQTSKCPLAAGETTSVLQLITSNAVLDEADRLKIGR